MSSQSSYVHHEQPHGLGRAGIQESDLQFYDERMIQQTTDSYSPGGTTQVKTTTATQPRVQPIPSTTSTPQTGGGHPVENPHTGVSPVTTVETTNPTSIVKVEADHLVINGNHRIDKKKAALIGGSIIGTAILLKLIL